MENPTPFELQKKHLEQYLDIDKIEYLKTQEAVVDILNKLFQSKENFSPDVLGVSRVTLDKFLEGDYSEKTYTKILNGLFYLKTEIHNIVTMQR